MEIVRHMVNPEYPGQEAATSTLPRSRLYSLVPAGLDTPLIESLTGYINHLAWTYRVEPRTLIAQEIVPHLGRWYHFRSSPSLLGTFCRSEAMSINGVGEMALDWSVTLSRLTMREDLRNLTLCSWVQNIPFQGLLRPTPAWCPVCYHEWGGQGLLIYQPLLWTLKVVTICSLHSRQLEHRCPCCQNNQSVIAAKLHPGYCTQCMNWLGMSSSSEEAESQIDEETRDWQQWILNTIGELRSASSTSGILPWDRLANGLALCSEILGSAKRLASLVGISKQLLSSWQNRKQTPSFERILELCYVLDLSPLQLMIGNLAELKESLQARDIHRPLRPRHFSARLVDREQALALIKAVLDGREIPMGVRQLERHLGLGARTLIYHFPQECALITTRYQAYRAEQTRKRIEQGCSEVRQAILILHAQETNPSANHVAAMLSDPGIMRTPEGLNIWHAVRRELGLES